MRATSRFSGFVHRMGRDPPGCGVSGESWGGTLAVGILVDPEGQATLPKPEAPRSLWMFVAQTGMGNKSMLMRQA